MATCSVPDDLTSVCSVCLEPYKGRNPKLLPCFHTFCLPCLQDLEIHHLALADKQVCEDDEGQRKSLTFPCPTCRAEITVPPGGVTEFQSNIYSREKTHKCDVCKRDEEAKYMCTECGHNMCTQCQQCHDIFTSNHQKMSCDTTVSEKGREENEPLTFPCPTCRTVITVPDGGVTQFQTNFYLNNETLTCDVCDRGKDAMFTCTECGHNMCQTCQRCHTTFFPNHQVQPLTCSSLKDSQLSFEPVTKSTVTEQLKLLEEALVTMSEEENTLQQERQAVGDVIIRRADAVRALVTQAEERSQRALVEVAESLGKQIEDKIITARDRHCRIWQLSSQGGAKGQLTCVPPHEQTALLSDEDFHIYKQQCSRGRQLQTLLHQFDDCAINMQVVEAYIGTVVSGTKTAGEDSNSLSSAFVCSQTRAVERQESDTPPTSLRSDMTQLTRDIADIKDKLAALETVTSSLDKQQTTGLELEALKKETLNLQSHVVSLKEADSRMQQNIDTFQQNVEKIRGDFSSLENELTKMEDKFLAFNFKLQNEVDSCQQNSLLIRTETKKIQDATEELSKSFKTFKEKASNLVAFNARLSEGSLKLPVILSKVDCNVGEAYDNTTGIFTAPVTGIYFFMARAMAVKKNTLFYLDILVDDERVAESGSFDRKDLLDMNCAVHVVRNLMKGQKVQLYVRCGAQLRCEETSFSGVLVQPDFNIM